MVFILDDKKKKAIMFWGTMLVAVMFISSYAAVGNNNVTSTRNTTTSTVNVRTYPAFGTANGVIVGYGQGATLMFNKSVNATTGNQIVSLLGSLEANGSINSYNPIANSNFSILLGTANAYGIQQLFRSKLSWGNSISVNSTSTLELPSIVKLYVSTQAASVRLSQTNYTVYMYPLRPPGTIVNVSVKATITANGTVYQNQLVVTLR